MLQPCTPNICSYASLSLSLLDIVFLTLLISIAPLFSICALLCLFIVSVHNVGAYTVNRTTTCLSSLVSFINPNASIHQHTPLSSLLLFSQLFLLVHQRHTYTSIIIPPPQSHISIAPRKYISLCLLSDN